MSLETLLKVMTERILFHSFWKAGYYYGHWIETVVYYF